MIMMMMATMTMMKLTGLNAQSVIRLVRYCLFVFPYLMVASKNVKTRFMEKLGSTLTLCMKTTQLPMATVSPRQ